jgi:GntR family transcriptional regulator, rspAB operon transcriptional repressor
MSERAYSEIRRMIVRLVLAPGDVVREDDLQAALGIGRTPIREALQRLARDQFVTVIPRRGMYVSGVDVGDLSLLYETRATLEPFAIRLASARGNATSWQAMAATLDALAPDATSDELLDADRRCREIVWAAAGNRFLTSTLDTLYAHSDRLWHLYLGGIADLHVMINEHRDIHAALVAGDADGAAARIELHMRRFNDQINDAVRARLEPVAGR